MFVAFFFLLKFDFNNSKLNEKTSIWKIVTYTLYTYSFNLLLIEFKQWYTQGYDAYFINGWNQVDLIGCSLLSSGIILKILCESYFISRSDLYLYIFDDGIIEIFYIVARYLQSLVNIFS